VPTLAKRYFRALKGSLEVRKNSEGDALTKWEEHIKRLERELQLLKLRKEHGEE
jgi:branched-subunit amino acid aminotransferase/4-amino-4-deoxychorismate lyase